MRQAGSSAYNYTTRRRGLSRFLAGSMVLAQSARTRNHRVSCAIK